ncbi:MAG TPA: TM0106 family RecB-like putative nuclease [Mycobacteriales bacterium]|nr:TM0106 family RecB-like putative nuclease [Mycobacteriales bacterium]
MTEHLLTPSKITAWLDCAHYLTLKHEVEAGTRKAPLAVFGCFARLIADKGLLHEDQCLTEYATQGRAITRIADQDRANHELFADWTERVGNPLDGGADVVYQLPLIHDGIRGIADFVARTTYDDGTVVYEPVDAKLARKEAKPGHLLQLCFYADALEALTGNRPRNMHIWLGSGMVETFVVDEFAPYWRRIQHQLAVLLAEDATTKPATRPEPCDHCTFCEFAGTCEEQWRSEDSLIYVHGLRTADRQKLEAAGLDRLATLANRGEPVTGIDTERLARLVKQASLQHAARSLEDGAPPPYLMIPAGADLAWGRGLEQLPLPDDGDVFLDFEGHPFWTPRGGLFFLFGLTMQTTPGTWDYKTWWANDRAEEAESFCALVDFIGERRTAYPGMHVYHYNHTERSSLERLARDHTSREVEVARLVETGAFVDLLAVVRNAIQVGTESYGLKAVERLAAYERGHEIDAGAGAVVSFEEYCKTGEQKHLDAIAAYNRDDVEATRALRDWLVANRPADLPWRDAVLEVSDDIVELDERIAALQAYGAGTPEFLLGDVLGYWRREWSAHLAPRLAKCAADPVSLYDDSEVLAGLVPLGAVDRIGKTGKVLGQAMRFEFPRQDTSRFRGKDQVLYAGPDGCPIYVSLHHLDTDAGSVDVTWPATADGSPRPLPTVLVRNDWVSPNPKPAALADLADRILDPSGPRPNPAALALLRRDLPRFRTGAGPAGGVFADDIAEMRGWAGELDGSYVAIQGPPGTGKTYRAAHLVLALLRAGKRVGVTAFSHHAIDNVLAEIVDVMTKEGALDLLNAVRRTDDDGALPRVTYTNKNPLCASTDFNVVAATTWWFAGKDMAEAPVDVLLVDEAGQLALADALAAARSARNLVLLGDPLQLPQVSQASHPGGGGHSVLQHVLGDDATIPPERGVFVTETRRMHPDVCAFISNEIYEGRLTSHLACAQQGTARFGTGLRRLAVEHVERSTFSPEEAEAIFDQIVLMLGNDWTDSAGVTQPLTAGDFTVVAPYNDQVDLLRLRLGDDPRTAQVQVGTVDKFQGRQAAVVMFSMATSSGSDIARSVEFLFSRNRLNVAISRARCLAYLVCTEALLNSRARDVEEMKLISTLCAFAEQVAGPASTASDRALDLIVVNPPYGSRERSLHDR